MFYGRRGTVLVSCAPIHFYWPILPLLLLYVILLLYKPIHQQWQIIQFSSVVSSTTRKTSPANFCQAPSSCLLTALPSSTRVIKNLVAFCFDCSNVFNISDFLLKLTDIDYENSSDSGLSVTSSDVSNEPAFSQVGILLLVPIQLVMPSYPIINEASVQQVQSSHLLIKWSLPPPSAPLVPLPRWNAMP